MHVTALSIIALVTWVVRRKLFEFTRRGRRAVSREEAAAGTGLSRKLAAFHLDKLVEVGLLRARSGPSPGTPRRVGRAPKVYEPADTDFQVSIPQRDHRLLAELLVDAVLAQTGGESARQAAVRLALQRGRELGGGERLAVPGPGDLDLAEDVLRRGGFEPYRPRPEVVRLHNCPFCPVSARAPELVCAMNHAYLAGLLSGLEAESVRAFLSPRAGECCVELRPLPARPAEPGGR
jgi:predicted ArsR family transcriptional regulator